MQQQTKMLSILIPTYNRAPLLIQALNSILDQELKDFEVIIVDDGSTDNTSELVRDFSLQLPEGTVLYIQQENQGVSSARNKGIQMSRGKYIAFLDSDDVWLKDVMNERIQHLEAHPELALVFSDGMGYVNGKLQLNSYIGDTEYAKVIFESGVSLDNAFDVLFNKNVIIACSVIVRASCLAQVGSFDERLRACEDVDLWLRVAAKYPIAFYPAVVMNRHLYDDNLSANLLLKYQSWIYVIRKVESFQPAYYRNNISSIRARLNFYHFWSGYFYFDKYEFKKARQELMECLKLKPAVTPVMYLLMTLAGPTLVKTGRKVKRVLEKFTKTNRSDQSSGLELPLSLRACHLRITPAVFCILCLTASTRPDGQSGTTFDVEIRSDGKAVFIEPA